MSDLLITLALIPAIAFFMFIWWLVQCYLEERRTKACKKACEELGLHFAPEDESVENDTCNFQLMNRGHSRELSNVTSAVTDDVTVRLFDYRYKTGSGKHESKHYQTVALIDAPELQLPSFQGNPEGFMDQINSLLGYQDIDFDSHREFSRAFVLTSPTENETLQFFDSVLLDFFASRPKLSFESDGKSFLFYEHKHSVKPRNLDAMIEEAYHVYSLLRNRVAALDECGPPMSPYAPEADPLLVS